MRMCLRAAFARQRAGFARAALSRPSSLKLPSAPRVREESPLSPLPRPPLPANAVDESCRENPVPKLMRQRKGD